MGPQYECFGITGLDDWISTIRAIRDGKIRVTRPRNSKVQLMGIGLIFEVIKFWNYAPRVAWPDKMIGF